MNIHFRFKVYIIIFLLFLGGCNFFNNGKSTKQYHVLDGQIDLQNWDFKRDSYVKLDGYWEFYWLKLLTPDDFQKGKKPLNKDYIKVPLYWNDYKNNGKTYPSYGYATYRLLINVKQNQNLAIYLPSVNCAHRLYINDKLIGEAGKIGKSYLKMIPKYIPKTYPIPANSNKLEIILQISNFNHKDGGIWKSIILGSREQLEFRKYIQSLLDIFLFGSLFIMAIYHLSIFILRRKDLSTIYFSLMCLIISLRTLLTNQRILINLFPNLDWNITFKMDILTIYFATLIFYRFLHILFPNAFYKAVNKMVLIINLFFLTMVIFTPSNIYTYTIVPFQLFLIIICLYIIIILIKEALNKSVISYLSLAGFLILTLTIINDILFVHNIIFTGFSVSIGLFLFLFFQSLNISYKFSMAFATSESLSKKLLKAKNAIEDVLNKKSQHLGSALLELKEKEKNLRNDLELARNIQHGIMPSGDIVLNNLKIIYYYKSIKEIGGDLIDIFNVKNGKTAILLGDVSGHGISSALISSMMKIIFLEASKSCSSPKEIFSIVNQTASSILKNKDYFTAFLCIFFDYEIIFGSAGHLDAIICRNNGDIEFWNTKGPLIGFELNLDFEEKIQKINKGDRIFLYSDGLVEQRFYHIPKNNIVNLIQKNKDHTLEKLKEDIISTIIKKNISDISDDISFVIIEVL